jgi:hypothetical protein
MAKTKDVKVGDHIQFRLYAGREVEGVVRAILKTSSGPKLVVEYGHNVSKIDPGQITYPSQKSL